MKESQRATARATTADDKNMNDISSSRSADLTPRDEGWEEESGEENAISESSSPFQPLGQIQITARVPTEDAIIGLSAGLSNAVSALSDDLLSAVQNFGEMIARKQDAISAVGILKRDEESGTIVSAVFGTDYGTYSKPDSGIPTNDIALSAITEDRIADEAVGESKLKKFTAWTAVNLPEGWTLHSVTWIERNSRWDCYIKAPDGGLYGGVTESGQPADGVEARFYVYVGSAYVSDEIIFNAKRSPMIPKKTSDLINDGDGESSFITKARAEEGWWGEWDIQVTYSEGALPSDYQAWKMELTQNGWKLYAKIGDNWIVENGPSGDANSSKLEWDEFVDLGVSRVVATRHRVCAPIPTKPSDIGAQPAGDYVKSEDVEPLQWAAWFPDGSVTSYDQCTQTLKYSFDTVNHTATVLAFAMNGIPGEGNNADATGDIVIPPYKDYDGVRYTVTGIDNGSYGPFASITSLKAPTTVTQIGYDAFTGCSSLAYVSLPSATSIGDDTFANCTSLTTFSLPAVTDIGIGAFFNCTSLATVSLPACTGVGGGALSYCTSLATVDFGPEARESVPVLENYAFESVQNTCKIIVPDANYDAWTAPKLPDGETDNPWYALVQAGYRFLKYSQWEAPHRYELDTKYTKPATGIPTNDIADGAVTEAKLAKFTEWVCSPATVYNYDHTTQYPLTVEWDDNDNAYGVFVEMGPVGRLGPFTDFDAGDSATELSVTMSDPELETTTITATRRRVIPSKTSDLENDGEDGTSPYVTKSGAEEGWWSEWTVEFYIDGEWTGIDDLRVQEEVVSASLAYDSNDGWRLTLNIVGGVVRKSSPSADAHDENATRLGFVIFDGDDVIRATRRRVAAPVPTKPEDIGAQAALTFDTAPTANSANPVTSGGIKTALDDKASVADATLTPVYSQTPTFGEWTYSGVPDGWVVETSPSLVTDPEILQYYNWMMSFFDGEGSRPLYSTSAIDSSEVVFENEGGGVITATRVRTDIVGYVLGSQTGKSLQPMGEFVKRSGDTMTGDLTVKTHAAVGNNIDFTKGGPENFAVGHDHYIYGKESFTVHDGNRIGAKGFYWKAIDTTEHKIYLTKEQIKYGNPIEPDSRCLPIVDLSDSLKISTHPEYDVPYFGPKANSAHQELFAAEEGIGIGISEGSLVGKYITVVNMWHDLYVRCFKVEGVDSTGSVITYSEVKQLSTYDAERTFYRKNVAVGDTISYHDNQYVIFFPEVDQSLIVGNHYVTATSFGCTALGDANHVMGYNSFASGYQNRAEGNYSTAIGSYNTASGVNSIALGQKAIASKNFDFVWNGNVDTVSHYSSHGKSTFNINPHPVSDNDPFTGVFIGDEKLSDRTIKVSTLKAALNGISTASITDTAVKNVCDAIINAIVNSL